MESHSLAMQPKTKIPSTKSNAKYQELRYSAKVKKKYVHSEK